MKLPLKLLLLLSLVCTLVLAMGSFVFADDDDEEANYCTVTFDANGGSFGTGKTTDTDQVEKGQNNSVWYSNPSKYSALFAGWATDKAGKNVVYTVPEQLRDESRMALDDPPPFKYNFTGDVTFYAVWSPGYTVTVDANSDSGGFYYNQPIYPPLEPGEALTSGREPTGYGTTVSVTKRPGLSLQGLDINSLSNTDPNKVAVGFATDKAGKNMVLKDKDYTGQACNDIEQYVPTRSMTMYAIWKTPYILTLYGNGGTFAKEGTSVYIDRVAPGMRAAFDGIFYRPGYLFAGYATDKAGKNMVYDGTGDYIPTGNATLYAIWKKEGSTAGTATATAKTAAKAKATKLTSVKAISRGFTVKWKKQSKAKGYQLQYSLNKKFKKGNKTITIKKVKTTSRTVKKLKARKTYYVRVRTFTKSGKKTIYSAWSASKKVTTKK